MKTFAPEKSGGRGPTGISRGVRWGIVLAALAVVAGLCAAPVFALVMLARFLEAVFHSLDGLLSALFAGLGPYLMGILVAFAEMARGFWLVVACGWSPLAWLLLVILGWLLSGGLP